MAEVKVMLTDGFKVGETVHKEAVIRSGTVADIIEANTEAEIPVATPDGYELIASPMMVGIHILRRQVVRIGEHDGPLALPEIKKLSVADMAILRLEADKLDAAEAKSVERGKP